MRREPAEIRRERKIVGAALRLMRQDGGGDDPVGGGGDSHGEISQSYISRLEKKIMLRLRKEIV